MEQKNVPHAAEVSALYEAPAIEEIVTEQDLTREVHYAGTVGPSNNIN